MHKLRTFKKRISKNYFLISGSIVGCILILVLLFSNNSQLSAQIADGFLRPLLGSQKTLLLESYYFNSIDKLTSLTFQPDSRPTALFSPMIQLVPTGKPETASDSMNLSPLSISHSLLPLSREGIWNVMYHPLFPKQDVLARTFIRPDSQRPYAIVSLVKMDMQKLGIGLQGGTYYPGGTRHVYGTGSIPPEIQKANTLVAAFNGGFQEKDGGYGMLLAQRTYVPLRLNLPTLVLSSTGSAEFIMFHGQVLPSTSVGIRQNGPYLVENGKVTSYVEAGTDTWGRTITNSTYTWRSGLGMAKNGDLIYAAGNSLVPQTLAEALVSAGAINAIQLDINPPWVRYILYQPLGNAQYTSEPLLNTMLSSGGYAYLHGYNKDFFYVYKK